MSESTKPGPIPASEIGKSVEELISMGCEFVVEGEVYKAVIDLIEKLILEASTDVQGEQYLLQLRGLLLTTSKPVKPRIREKEKSKIILPH